MTVLVIVVLIVTVFDYYKDVVSCHDGSWFERVLD